MFFFFFISFSTMCLLLWVSRSLIFSFFLSFSVDFRQVLAVSIFVHLFHELWTVRSFVIRDKKKVTSKANCPYAAIEPGRLVCCCCCCCFGQHKLSLKFFACLLHNPEPQLHTKMPSVSRVYSEHKTINRRKDHRLTIAANIFG